MSTSIEKYEDLVQIAQEQRDEKIRLKASMDNIIQNLKGLGYSKISEAKLALEKKQNLLSKKIGERDKKVLKFKENYGHLLNKK